MILLKKDLNVLEEGIKEGRKAFANVMKYIKITASSNFGNIFSIVIAGACLPFLPMTSLQILLLNLLYDVLCLSLPWDHVDEEMCLQPLEWSGKTLSRFMRFFGPISSFFDILTFLYLFFMLCPSICGGPFASLSDSMQVRFIALFQTGWFSGIYVDPGVDLASFTQCKTSFRTKQAVTFLDPGDCIWYFLIHFSHIYTGWQLFRTDIASTCLLYLFAVCRDGISIFGLACQNTL